MTRTKPLQGQSERDIEDILKTDFRIFAEAVWKELNLPPLTRAQRVMCDYLQNGPKRLQLQCFRGIGKSWITAAFVLWTLFKDSDKKIMVVSASKERADNFTIFCQKLILDIAWLSHLRPKTSDQRWSRISFDVGTAKPHQAPSVKSVGISGQMTGSRADLLILDDVEVVSNSSTDALREKLMQLCSEAEAILTPKPDSRVLFLGTPQTTFTIYRKLAERGYRPIVWPSRYPDKVELYEGVLAPELLEDLEEGRAKPGEPTDTRFSDIELMEREASMGRSNFQLQFQLNTTLSDQDKFPLRFADFIVCPLGNEIAEKYSWSADPRYVLKDLPAVGLPGDRWYSPMFIDASSCPYSETIISIDPSGRGLDETVACVLSQANGYIFLRDMAAFRDGYSDNTLTDIVRLAKRYQAGTLLVESNFGDGMICELLKRHMIQQGVTAHVEEVRASVRKEQRIIDTLEPVLNQHRLVIDPKVIEWDYRSNPQEAPEKRLEYMLMYQLSRLCNEKGAVKHDDRVDSLSQGVQWFTDALALSANKQQAQRRNDEWSAMQYLMQDEPYKAMDALALGIPFHEMQRRVGTRAYDWVS